MVNSEQIKISKELKSILTDMKIIPRETFNDVITRKLKRLKELEEKEDDY